MELTTVTWNIGGGKLLEPGKDPSLMASYTIDGLDEIANKLATVNPDVITIQEAEGSSETNQIAYLAQQLGYKYFFYDATSDSHLNSTQNLGNGLLSKYPISAHRAGFFLNPDVEFDLEGTTVKSHDKGYGQCTINVNGTRIRATSLHLLPFRRMGIELDSEVADSIYESVADELQSDDMYQLIQGDFNIDDVTVGQYLSTLFKQNQLVEIHMDRPTTPKDRTYDHVLMKGLDMLSVKVDDTVKTDHYPVISRLTLN